MRFAVRPLRYRGRILPWREVVNRPALVGDLRIEEVPRPELREVVGHLEVAHGTSLAQHLTEQRAQPRYVQLAVPELVHDAHLRARDVFVEATAAERGAFEQVGWVLAGMDREQPGPVVRDATITDTDALLGEVGYSAAEIAALREQGAAA